jgi:predicted nuclease with TOPRIM domain
MSDDDDDDELVQVSHLVPDSVKADAQENSGHGDLSDAVRQAYRIVAYGDDYEDTARLKQRLERARNEFERLVEQKEQIEREMRDVKGRIDSLEDKLDESEQQDEAFNEELDLLEDAVKEGEHIFPTHGKVEAAAEIGGVPPEDVIDTIRERNPDIPDDAFVPAHEAEFAWNGIEDTDIDDLDSA